MIFRNISKVAIISLLVLIWFLPTFADAPYEKFHVKYDEISKDVLKNTIGILTINSGVKKGIKFRTYSESNKEFIFDQIIEVKNTIPLSSFGYQPSLDEEMISNYRYPIVSVSNRYRCIVYDPKNDLRAWINLDEVEEDFYVETISLDSLSVPGDWVVDIFSLTKDNRRAIFMAPQEGTDSIIISSDLFAFYDLRIVDERDGFVRLKGAMPFASGYGKGTLQLNTWIRKRDEEGNLTIWPIDIPRD